MHAVLLARFPHTAQQLRCELEETPEAHRRRTIREVIEEMQAERLAQFEVVIPAEHDGFQGTAKDLNIQRCVERAQKDAKRKGPLHAFICLQEDDLRIAIHPDDLRSVAGLNAVQCAMDGGKLRVVWSKENYGKPKLKPLRQPMHAHDAVPA